MTQITLSESLAASHPLVSRLMRLRGRVRAILALFGAGVLLASAVGGLFVLMLADYLLHFNSPALRLILLAAWLIAVALLTWRFLLLPLTTRLTDQFLASRVENLHKDLTDELMSAVHFIHTRAATTNALAARHIDAAAQRTASIRFEEAVDFRHAGKALGLAALTVLLVTVVGALNPALSRIAISRWLSASPIAWPLTTHVAFDWSDYGGSVPKVIPLGEKFTLRAIIDKGSQSRVWLYQAGKRPALMTFQKEQSSRNNYVYETALEPEGASLALRIEAGDDADEPGVRIALAPRPIIQELSAAITPPPYVKNLSDLAQPAPAVVVDLLSQAARAVEHASIALRIKASKPFLLDSAGQPRVRLLDQNKDEDIPLAMTRKLLESDVAQITFPAVKTLQARVVMNDSDGFENRVGGGLSIEVVPDGLPTIIITEPRRSIERTPAALVQLALQATDDQGLDGLKLEAVKFDAKADDKPVFETPIAWLSRTVDPALRSTTGRATFTWNLKPLNLTPGTRLLFYAMVQDNYDFDGQRHPWVKSSPLSLQIRTESEIIEASRKDLNEVKERIKTLRTQQETTRSLTEAIKKIVDASNVATSQQKSQLSDLAQQEGQEAASASAIQQRVAQIADNLQQNLLGDGDLGKIAQDVSTGMQQVGQETMPRAATDLNRAQDAAGNSSQNPQQSKAQAQQTSAAAASANAQQEQAIAKMDQLIDRLGAAGDFEAARQAVAKILQQQLDLNKQTRDISPSAIGKKPEDLPKNVRDQEQKIASDQKSLSDQTNQVIEQMKQSADSLAQSDPASAQSLQRAADTGQQSNVSGSQSSASSSVSSNNTQTASNAQGQATAGLQQMMDELNKNERRQLEQLARQLQELIKALQDIRARQDTLNKDTITAGAAATSDVLLKLGDRQGTLHQNTIVIQKRAENTREAQSAAGDIREAADDMAAAAGALNTAKQPDTIDPQTKALAALDRAIDKLKKAAEKVASQLKSADLAEYIKKYESIKTDQTAVKTKSDAIETRRQAADDKEIDRQGILQLAGLTKDQTDLIQRVNDLSADDKLKPFDVVVWMNGQVTEAMDASKGRLTKTQTGPQLALAQQTSIDRLQMIIDALKEEQRRESDFQNGGGGGGGGGQRPLVPPLAQLKLLKAMQVVVNGETTSAGNAIQAAKDDSEKTGYQQQVENLGKKQGEIKGIADKLVQQMH